MQTPETSEGFDEYLWPTVSLPWSCDWKALAEGERVRRRLEEIYEHVRRHHIEPRVRRAAEQSLAELRAQISASIVAGAPDAPLWERDLKEPVPRALREEWSALCSALKTARVR